MTVMKKFCFIISLLLSLFIIDEVKALSPTIYVDGSKTNIKGEIIDGRTFVSLKTLCEELDCQYGYKSRNDKLKEIVTIYANVEQKIIDDTTSSTALIEIEYKLGTTVYQPYVTLAFNELENKFKLKEMDEVESVVKGSKNSIPYIGETGTGDLYVPIRFIANGLGRQVEWNGETRSIYISLAKPENYEHLLLNEKVDFGSKIDQKMVSNEVSVGKCLTAVASQNGKVSSNATLLSFIGGSTELKDDGQYKISNSNEKYFGSFSNICSYDKGSSSTKIVSITTPNYYPYVQVHSIKSVDAEKTENESDFSNNQKEENGTTVNIPRVLINVPIDSRPVTRSKLNDLATSAGYNYLEITDGITDYVNNDFDNSWVVGDSRATRNQLKQYVQNNNNKNTSVIIDTSSYIFGGLGATRSPSLYNDLSAVNELGDLIKDYNKPTYYVTAVVPRVYPEQRLDDWSWPIKVGGLNYYLNGANNESYKISYTEALVEWYYLKYMNEANNNYDSWPIGVKTFYNNFFTWYVDEGSEKTTWEYQTYNSNVVKPWEYENMYKRFYDMFKLLLQSQQQADFELILLVDDYELPKFILANQDKYDWIIKDSDGKAIKYSASYDVITKIEDYINNSNNHKINLIYGADEINHLILARDLVKNGGPGLDLDVNYSYRGLKDYIGNYDKASVGELIDEASWFINEYSGSSSEKVDMQMVKIETNNDQAINKIYNNSYKLVNRDDTVMITNITVANYEKYFINQMMNDNVFSIPYLGGWNTSANAIGISLSSIAVYNDLKNDIDECVKSKKCGKTLTSDLEKRLIAYDKTRIVNVLEDEVYNKIIKDTMYTYSNNIDLNYNNILAGVTNSSKPFKIGNYSYYYDDVSYHAYNPWPRTFEVMIDVDLGNIVYK